MGARVTDRELDAAQDHIAAADDILDFLDGERGGRSSDPAREMVTALKAHTHATLAVAHALLAAHTTTPAGPPS